MKKTKCLILNDREPIPREILHQFENQADFAWFEWSNNEFEVPTILDENRDTEVLLTTYMDLSAENLCRLPYLESIITTTTAVDYIDHAYCRKNGISVFNTPNYSTASVAEHAIALMFGVGRQICVLNEETRGGNFNCFAFRGVEFNNKTAGVIGLGNIGQHVATMAQGIGMNVIFNNPSVKQFPRAHQVDLDTLLTKSDVVFITAPLNAQTYQLISKEAFSKMRRFPILISISHDKIIDLNALKEALQFGQLAGAGLDIHGKGSQYFELPQSIISPRRAWYTNEAFERRFDLVAQTFAGYLNNVPINHALRDG